jgi:ADP-ribose pyrophosphatase YjhB (NUDIX family)
MEETGVTVEILRLIEVSDVIHRRKDGRVASHHVLTVFLAQWTSGSAMAASDASAVAWAEMGELEKLPLLPGTASIVRTAVKFLPQQLSSD